MLKIYCDGACSGNPGPGGWAFVIPERGIEQSDYELDTTNNRMEITAVYKALKYLYDHLINLGENIEIITDSQYVINTMTQSWKKNKYQGKQPLHPLKGGKGRAEILHIGKAQKTGDEGHIFIQGNVGYGQILGELVDTHHGNSEDHIV